MTLEPYHPSTRFDNLAGAMAEAVRAFDWSTSPVGPLETWPASLLSTVSTLLECQLPMYLAWGPQFTQFYNDAYRPILGDKATDALGHAAPITWSEIWPTIGPMWEEVLNGCPIGFDDFKLTIERFGYREDCYFNFSYSPVRDDHGRPAGVLVTFAETTQRVRSEQRLRFLDDLSQATRQHSEPAEVMRQAAERLGRHLGVNRCAYAQVLADEDTFDLVGDFNHDVPSIVGRYRFADFGDEVLRLMREGKPYVNHDVDSSEVTGRIDLSAYRLTNIQSVICVPLRKEGRLVAAMAVHQASPRRWSDAEIELVQTVVDRCWEALELLRVQSDLREEARSLEILNQVSQQLSAELDLQSLLQRVTDATTALTGAAFGALFYNRPDAQGHAQALCALSGEAAGRENEVNHPRAIPLLAPTFAGQGCIRLDDVLKDACYGQWDPYHGLPGSHVPVRSYLAVPVVGRSGEPIGGLVFGHGDVGVFSSRSERLAAGVASQAAIAIDNARLLASVRHAADERHRLLDSERAARAAAEHASLLKDQFLATLSHELRTPLSAILGWVHLFRRKLCIVQPELVRGVDVVERSAKSQLRLVEDLLDMSRIESGKLVLERRPMLLSDVVHSSVEMVAQTAQNAGVELHCQIDAVGYVLGDAQRLQQAIWNLLTNAVKFTPRGGSVRLALRHSEGQAVVEVADTGIGIAPAFLPHVFDRFRQGDGSTSRQFGGLGLGLSIVQQMAKLHGGDIRAASDGAGRGAVFVLRLPLAPEGVAGVARAANIPVDTPSIGSRGLLGMRILVVDDDPELLDLLKRFLGDEGANVVVAEDAAAALQSLALSPPDALVSDIGMPGIDGYQLMRQIRELPPAQGGLVPAIALTAFAREQDRAQAIGAGFTEHVTKPVDLEALSETLVRLVGSAARSGG